MNPQQTAQLGSIIIIVGFVILILSLLAQGEKKGKNVKFTIIGFLGFIPFGFGNDKKLLMLGIAPTIAFAILTAIAFSRMKP